MVDEVVPGCNRQAQVRKRRWNMLTAARRQRFLDVLAATANVARAAEEAGANPSSFYYLRQRDTAFAEAWRLSLANSYTALEARLLAQALGTTEQPPGDADRVADVAPFDPRLALDVLRRRDAESKVAPGTARRIGYKYMPIADVERSLIAKLEVLERFVAKERAAAARAEGGRSAPEIGQQAGREIGPQIGRGSGA